MQVHTSSSLGLHTDLSQRFICTLFPGTILTEVSSRSEALEIANGVLQAFASGTFIFVTFFEILQEEIDPHDTSIGKIACVMAGFMTMALLVLIPDEPNESPTPTSTFCNASATNHTSMLMAMTTETLRFAAGG